MKQNSYYHFTAGIDFTHRQPIFFVKCDSLELLILIHWYMQKKKVSLQFVST